MMGLSRVSSDFKSPDGRLRGGSLEPWDEQDIGDRPGAKETPKMKGGNDDEESTLEDGDLPPLSLPPTTGIAEMKKQRKFWSQLDSPTSRSDGGEENDNKNYDAVCDVYHAEADDIIGGRTRRRFDKPTDCFQAPPPPRRTTSESREVLQDGACVLTQKSDNHRCNRADTADHSLEPRREYSDDSDGTKDSKEYVLGEHEDLNFCDHALSAAIEALCGDPHSAVLNICGGTDVKTTKGDFSTLGAEQTGKEMGTTEDSPRNAKFFNIFNAPDDSVDEHTAIEVEYVQPEETNARPHDTPELWSASRKNAHLAAMARKAKEDFEENQARVATATAAVGHSDDNRNERPSDIPSSDVYNNFNATEKRTFLGLINSGMTPTESAYQIRAQRDSTSKDGKQANRGGKLFKFWKKSRAKSAIAGNDKGNGAVEGCDGIGLHNGCFPQEEKKEEDRHVSHQSEKRKQHRQQHQRKPSPPPGSPHAETMKCETTFGGDVAAVSQLSRSQSQSSFYDVSQKESTLHPISREPKTQKAGLNGKAEEPRRPIDTLSESTQGISEESSRSNEKREGLPGGSLGDETSSEPSLADKELVFFSEGVSNAPIKAEGQDLPQLPSPPLGLVGDCKESFSTVEGMFARSGINYYDAVRRELSESEEEPDLSTQVSFSTSPRRTLNRGHRLGPILQNPKLMGFSKLAKGDDQADKLASKTKKAGKVVYDTIVSPTTSEDREVLFGMRNDSWPTGLKKSSARGNPTSEKKTREEEDAIEKIEEELLRPVSSSMLLPNVARAAITPDSSGCAGTLNGGKTADKLREQIEAVPSPTLPLSTTPSSALEPVAVLAATESTASTSSPAFKTSTPPPGQGLAMLSSSAAAYESPLHFKAAPALEPHSPFDSVKVPAASKLAAFEWHQEGLSLNMLEYFESAKAFSQVNQVNDSLSVASYRSLDTVETGPYLQGTVATKLTQSSRKRRPGAAKTRLARAKEAERQTRKKQGWQESIKDAAGTSNRAWQPQVGWVDYTEPAPGRNAADLHAETKLHLNLLFGKRSKNPVVLLSSPSNSALKGSKDASFVGSLALQAKAGGESDSRPSVALSAAPKAATSSDLPDVEGLHREATSLPQHGFCQWHIAGSHTLDRAQSNLLPSQTRSPPAGAANNSNRHADDTKTERMSVVYHDTQDKSRLPTAEMLEVKPLAGSSLSCDDLSIEQSVALSAENFVQSMDATSPARPRRRKTATGAGRTQRLPNSPSKRSGWVDSMRAASASIERDGQRWNPMSGWAKTDSTARNEVLDDVFSPPSTRFEQKTIEEGRVDGSETLGADENQEMEFRLPCASTRTTVERMLDSSGNLNSICQGTNNAEISMPVPPQQVSNFTDSLRLPQCTEVVAAGEGEDGEAATHEPSGEFPVGGLEAATVAVVKQKVDEEDINWFPESRKSSVNSRNDWKRVAVSSQGSLIYSPQLSVISSQNSSRRLGDLDVDRKKYYPADSVDGVIWNGVVFETKNFLEGQGLAAQAETETHASVSYPSKRATSKKALKLSQNKRDTSPLRVPTIAVSSRCPSHDHTAEPTSPHKRAAAELEGSCVSSSQRMDGRSHAGLATEKVEMAVRALQPEVSPNLEKRGAREITVTTHEREPAVAARSVAGFSRHPWRKTSSLAASPKLNTAESFEPVSSNSDKGDSHPTKPAAGGVVGREESLYLNQESASFHSEDRSFCRAAADQGPAASYVRLRAKQWEGRGPAEAQIDECLSRLNTATAELKSYLGKQVRSGSVAATEQKEYTSQNHPLEKAAYSFCEHDNSLSGVGALDGPTGGPASGHDQIQMARVQQGFCPTNPGEGEVILQVNASEKGQVAATEESSHSDDSDLVKPFFERLAGCTAPMMPKRGQTGEDTMAHVVFLRTSPHIQKSGSSRFIPQYLCGRPDGPLEDGQGQGPDKAESEVGVSCNEGGKEKKDHTQKRQMESTIVKEGDAKTDTRSVTCDDFGAKTAYLEALAIKSAVSRPRRCSNRGGDRSVLSATSSNASHFHKERWKGLMEKKSKSGTDPGCGDQSDIDAATRAECYAATRVEKMMAMMASGPKSAPRTWRSPNNPNRSTSRVVENMVDLPGYALLQQETSSDNPPIPLFQHKSESIAAAEQLASAKVHAMMQALASGNTGVGGLEEGEI